MLTILFHTKKMLNKKKVIKRKKTKMRVLLNTIKNLRKKYGKLNIAVKASLWFTLCSIIQKGISILTLPIFTRIMTTKQYGEYSVFLTWFNILIIIITLNIQLDIFNKGLIDHHDKQDAYTANQVGLLIVLSIVFGVMYLLFRNPLNHIMGLTTKVVLIMIVEILATAITTLWFARKRFSFEYKKIVSVTIFSAVINPVVGIIAVLLSTDKTVARILSNAVVSCLVAITLIVFISRKGCLFKNIRWWKPVVFTSIPLMPHYLSLVLLNQSDKLMINYFVGSEQTAIYSIAHSAGLLMTMVNTSINGSFVPWAYGKLKDGKGNAIKKISNSLLVLVMIVNLYVIWLAPEVIKLMAAPQYTEAIWCIFPVAMSVFFFFVYTLFVDIEIYYGANNYIAIASIGAAALNIVLNYVFIPMCGYIAAGYTTLISYFVTMVMHYVFMTFVMKKNGCQELYFDKKAIVVLTICMMLLSSVALLLYRHTIIRLMVIAIISGVMFRKRSSIIIRIKQIKK